MPLVRKVFLCKVEGCTRNSRTLKMCSVHYSRWTRTGILDTRPALKSFEAKLRLYSKINENNCWEWQRYKKKGYGYTNFNGRILLAHRASWEHFVGKIEEGMQINHKCHNRSCINPDHLYVGTHQDNMNDMILAGRSRKGSKSVRAKLNEESVILIRHLLREGKAQAHIAKRFNISESTISRINNKINWAHV